MLSKMFTKQNTAKIQKPTEVAPTRKKKVSKPTVYKWMNKYEAFADINKIQGRYFFGEMLCQVFPPKPIERPPEQEFVGVEMEVPFLKGFKNYKEFLEYVNMNKKSFDELLKIDNGLKTFYDTINKLRTIKHEYQKYKWSKATDGSKKKFPPKRKALN